MSAPATTTDTQQQQQQQNETTVPMGHTTTSPPESAAPPPALNTPLEKLPLDADVTQILGQLTQEQQLRRTMQQQYEELAKKNAVYEQREKERVDAEVKKRIADITKLHVEYRQRFEENKKRVPMPAERERAVLDAFDAFDAELKCASPSVAKLEELLPAVQMQVRCSNDYTDQQAKLNETTAALQETMALLKDVRTRQFTAEQIQKYNALMTGTQNLLPPVATPPPAAAAAAANATAVRCNASIGQPNFSLDSLLTSAQQGTAASAAATATPATAASAAAPVDDGPIMMQMQMQTMRASADYFRDAHSILLDEIPDLYATVKREKGGIEPTYDECNRYALQNAAYRRQACTMRASFQPGAKPLVERVNYRGEYTLDTGADEYFEYMADAFIDGDLKANASENSAGAAYTERAAERVLRRAKINDGDRFGNTWMLQHDPRFAAFILKHVNDPRLSGSDLWAKSRNALDAIRAKNGKGPRWYDPSKVTPTGLSNEPIDPPMSGLF